MSDDPPDADYLSASLELTESAHGEMAKFIVAPVFDLPQMEFRVNDGDEGAWMILNRRQIECLSDFLVSWLTRLK